MGILENTITPAIVGGSAAQETGTACTVVGDISRSTLRIALGRDKVDQRLDKD